MSYDDFPDIRLDQTPEALRLAKDLLIDNSGAATRAELVIEDDEANIADLMRLLSALVCSQQILAQAGRKVLDHLEGKVFG